MVSIDSQKDPASENCAVCGAVLHIVEHRVTEDSVEEMLSFCSKDCHAEYIKNPELVGSDGEEDLD